jgi:hypothetical protein
MDKLHSNSADSMDMGYSWFDVPHTNTSTIGFNKQTIVPSAFSGGQIDFTIKVTEDNVIDLSETYLKFSLKVTKDDGNDLETDPAVWIGDNIGHSIFQTLSVKYNGQTLEYVSSYPTKAAMWNLLHLDGEEKKNNGRLYGWIHDANTGTDGVLSDTRKALTKTQMEFYIKLKLSSFNLNRYIAPGSEITIQLTLARPQLVLQAASATPTGGGKYTVIDPVLHVLRLVPNASLLQAAREVQFTNRPVYYPIKKEKFSIITSLEEVNKLRFQFSLIEFPKH